MKVENRWYYSSKIRIARARYLLFQRDSIARAERDATISPDDLITE
jgi:hypothetical protein